MRKLPKNLTIFDLLTLPESKNFSEYTEESLFERGDAGEFEDRLYSDANAKIMLKEILLRLDNRGKIIFMYELLKQLGFNLTNEEYCETLTISRPSYYLLLKKVRTTAKKTLQDIEHR